MSAYDPQFLEYLLGASVVTFCCVETFSLASHRLKNQISPLHNNRSRSGCLRWEFLMGSDFKAAPSFELSCVLERNRSQIVTVKLFRSRKLDFSVAGELRFEIF